MGIQYSLSTMGKPWWNTFVLPNVIDNSTKEAHEFKKQTRSPENYGCFELLLSYRCKNRSIFGCQPKGGVWETK